MGHRHGLPGWTDLAAADPEEAVAFYTTLFGWDAVEIGAQESSASYFMFQKEGNSVAGLGELPPDMQEAGIPSQWNTYVVVDDAAAVAEAATGLGGVVAMPATPIMSAGRMAFVIDPTGAGIGFWEPGDHPGAEVFNQPGTMCWNELATRDATTAAAFYSRLLPWEAHVEEMTGGANYTTLLLDDRPIGGLFNMGHHWPDSTPPHWLTYFAVSDTDETVSVAKNMGASMPLEPRDSPFGRVAHLVDKQGASFRVISLTDPLDYPSAR